MFCDHHVPINIKTPGGWNIHMKSRTLLSKLFSSQSYLATIWNFISNRFLALKICTFHFVHFLYSRIFYYKSFIENSYVILENLWRWNPSSGWQERVGRFGKALKIFYSQVIALSETGLRAIRGCTRGSAGRGWFLPFARIEMSDLQATLEFSLELCKFYNVDLFQRG